MMVGTRLRLTAAAACAIAALCVSQAVAASPWVNTSWMSTELSQQDCLAKADQAIRNGGFQATDKLKESRFGGTGDYTVLIRCIASKNIIFFAVAGPNAEQADKYVTKLEEGF
jgi:hypothetical protein